NKRSGFEYPTESPQNRGEMPHVLGKHRKPGPGVPKEHPRHPHGDRAGQVQGIRQGITACDQRQRKQNFNLIVVHRFEQPVNQQAASEAEQYTSYSLAKEEDRQMSRLNAVFSRGDLQQAQKEYNADTIVE